MLSTKRLAAAMIVTVAMMLAAALVPITAQAPATGSYPSASGEKPAKSGASSTVSKTDSSPPKAPDSKTPAAKADDPKSGSSKADSAAEVVSAEIETATSEHYVFSCPTPKACPAVVAVVGDAKKGTELLEAAYVSFGRLLGATPVLASGSKLQVRLFASRKEWVDTVQTDGAKLSDEDWEGIYSKSSRNATLYLQTTAHHTRTVMLHEAFHQFHHALVPQHWGGSDVDGGAGRWYIEGIAEYAACHIWDGKTLSVGVREQVGWEDPWAMALKRVNEPIFSLAHFADGEAKESWPVWMALTAYLRDGEEGKYCESFRSLAKFLEVGSGEKGLFRKHMGDPALIEAGFKSWLAEHQMPWKTAWVEFEQVASNGFVGWDDGMALCTFKGAASEIEVTMQLPVPGISTKGDRKDAAPPAAEPGTGSQAKPSGFWQAGLVLSYTDNDNLTLGLVESTGKTSIARMKDGKWTTTEAVKPWTPGKSPSQCMLKASRKDNKVTLSVCGAEVGSCEHAGGQLGLVVIGGRMSFSDIKVVSLPTGPTPHAVAGTRK